VTVALDTGFGERPAASLDEGRDDVALELFGVVEDVVIDAPASARRDARHPRRRPSSRPKSETPAPELSVAPTTS